MSSIRYLFRRLLRSPGFTAITIATVALAIGVNLGVFSVTRSVLFTSLGVPESDRILEYTLGSDSSSADLSGPAYLALRDASAINGLLAWKVDQFHVQSGNGSAVATGALASGNTFEVLRLKPYLGRFFDASDDAPGGGRTGWTAVLGYDYWKTFYGASRSVVGQSIQVNGAPVRIVGVLPRDFGGLMPPFSAQMVLPHSFESVTSPQVDRFASPNYREWLVFGRQPKDTSRETLQAQLQTIAPLVRKAADPKQEIFSPGTDVRLSVQSGKGGTRNGAQLFQIPLLAMQGLAGILFVLCCCNLALLFAGRASREARSAAVRAALGERARDSVRFAMLEAAAFALLGSMLAAPLAWACARTLSIVIRSIPGLDSFSMVSPNLPLLLAAAACAVALASVAAACATLWYAGKPQFSALSAGSRSVATRSNHWIVGIEVFSAILLITTASTGWMGFETLLHQDPGFTPDAAVIAALDLEHLDPEHMQGGRPGSIRADATMQRITEHIRNAPGIQSVAMMSVAPLSGVSSTAPFASRRNGGKLQGVDGVWAADVSASYFSTIGTRILRGRDFAAGDLAGDPVCVVSANAATAFFGTEDSVARYLYSPVGGSQAAAAKPYCRIIGTAENAHFKSISDAPPRIVYLLSRKALPNLVVRAANGALAVQAVRSAIQAIAPDSLISGIDPIRTLMEDDLRPIRIVSLFVSMSACLTAAILGIGVFGVLALQVSQRTREIGVQIALGANRTAICFAVFRKLRVSLLSGVVLGSVLGLPAAASVANYYTLPVALAVAAYLCSLLLLLLLILVAAAIPIGRALSISPTQCLAAE